MKSLIRFFARQTILANLITIFVIITGVASAMLIRREVFPTVAFDIITVTTPYPGAGADEVEKLVTNPIEQELKAVDGIRKVTSDSVENLSSITVELDPDQTTEAKGKQEIQDAIDRWTQRPSGVENPQVVAVNTKQIPVIEVTLHSETVPLLELREEARKLKKKLEFVPGVARVSPLGLEDLEIQVEADPNRLRSARVSLGELIQSLQAQNVTIPGGKFAGDSPGTEKVVRTLGEFKNPTEVLATVVRSNDFAQPLRVSNLATAKYGVKDPQILYRTSGQPSISLTIIKKEMEDAIELVERVKKEVALHTEDLKSRGIQVTFVNDLSRDIRVRLSVLNDNLYLGILLVLAILAFALPFKLAVVVSLAIPFSYLSTIVVFYNLGYSLNLISLIGLIIVTGLLVDNTVVIADNAYRKMQEGESPEDAVVEGTYEVWASVTAAALVTISVFVPMAFMTGIFGKFVREIPISVIVALSVTLLQGFIILPSLILRWVRARPLSQVTAQGTSRFKQTWENWVQKVFGAYQSSLKRAVQKRYWVLLGAAGLLVGSIVFAGQFMRVILFPPDGIEQFFVRIEGPTPTSLQGTTELVQSVERTVAKLPPSELESYSTQVGVHQNDPGDPATRRGSQLAQVWIFLTNSQTRERTADEIIEGLRKELGTPPGVTRISFARVQGGPPVGMPISIGIQGEDYAEIQRAAERIKAIAAAVPGARDVIDSYLLGKEEVRVRINGAEARAAQLTVRDAGAAVRAAFDGIVATSIRSLDEEVDVRVSLKTDGRDIRGILANLSVPNAQGDLVPLSRIATFEKGQSLAVYEHEDNRREIRVYGEVDVETTSAQKVNAEINRLLPEVRKDFPNLRIVFGGEDRDTQESFAALGRSFIVALLGMFLILVALFKKISQPVLLIISIPLGVISVIWTLFFHGMPISFMAILGIISLAGVIVNNAIVLIDFINQARSRGLDRFESIYDAASIRLRPIVLTSISAVVGVMPTAYGIGGLDMFVVPIALALGWGLIFGQILTVYVLPCAVAAVDDVVDWIDRRVKKVPA